MTIEQKNEISRLNGGSSHLQSVNDNGRNQINSIFSDFLTDEELRIIDEIPNPEMKKIIKEIIEELGKQICNGEKPSSTLLDNVCWKIMGKYKEKGGIYRGYTKSIIRKLPDWKYFTSLFEYAQPNENQNVIEFRKKRSQNPQKSTEKTASIQPTIPYSTQKIQKNETIITHEKDKEEKETQMETKTEEIKTKKEKVEAQYDTIDVNEYENDFSNLKLTKGETNVPLLKAEDIAFSTYSGLYSEETSQTKVPMFHAKGRIEQFFKSNDESKIISNEYGEKQSKTYSFYNEKYDVTDIIVFCTGRGIDAGMHIAIKGKVSQKDAAQLIKYLKEKYNFRFDSTTGYPVSNDEYMQLKWTNIQETIMDYFNNK